MPGQERRTSVLVVDDDPIVLRVVQAMLEKAGFAVSTETSAESAIGRIAEVDLVISDDHLPGMRGCVLLETVRSSGELRPFILMTSTPTVARVVDAYEMGVTSFLTKPFEPGDLLRTVRLALDKARAGDATMAFRQQGAEMSQRRLHESLDRALAGLKMAFQPIACLSTRTIFGYEALMRCSEPGFPHPGAVLAAAETLGRLHEVGRRVRALSAASFRAAPAGTLLFVNLHPMDLTDEALFGQDEPLAEFASHVVLEITERMDFHLVPEGPARLERLRALGYRLAVDDLGAGYSGLTSLVDMSPEIVKLDMALVRGIDHDPCKRRVVGSLIRLCAELDRVVTAEGVETREELEALRELGCDLVQGYLLARPGPAFPEVLW